MPAWFPVPDGVQLPAIPTPVNGQITIERAIPFLTEIVLVSSSTITSVVVTKFDYSLSLLTEVTIASHTELGLTVIGTILPDTVIADIITPDSDTNSGSLGVNIPVFISTVSAPEILHAGDINAVYIDDTITSSVLTPVPQLPDVAPLIWHFDGADGSTSIVSTGSETITATVYSNAALSTVQKKFGTASLYIAELQVTGNPLQDPTVDRIQFSPTQKLGITDWCIEFWWYPHPTDSTTYATIYSIACGPLDDFDSYKASVDVDYFDNSVRHWYATTGEGISFGTGYDGTFIRNQWNHIAWYRTGLEYYVATNGIVDTLDKRTDIGPIEDFQDTTHIIGDFSGDSLYSVPGDYVDEVRITYGSSPYGSNNFTPPVAPFS